MKKSKIIASIVAAVICGSTMLGGTMAWQSISQEATNEVKKSVNPGGRLHDDFNGSNKDIYVENFGEQPIFARIKLKEYFEVGMDAGDFTKPERIVDIITTGAVREDKNTWPTHLFSAEDVTASHWKWYLGGLTQYMPTFDMNKDSVQPDINGSIDDPDGPYTSYKDWQLDEAMTDYEIVDADTNDIDELYLGTGISGENYIVYPDRTHVAQNTANANLISMAEWQDMLHAAGGYEPTVHSNYWVCDTDGWVYYSNPIPSKSASGLLLDKIEPLDQQNNFYYAIHVIAQFVTADDVGSPADGEGFYAEHGPPSDAALKLLVDIGAITELSAEKYGLSIESAQSLDEAAQGSESDEAEAQAEAEPDGPADAVSPEQEPESPDEPEGEAQNLPDEDSGGGNAS